MLKIEDTDKLSYNGYLIQYTHSRLLKMIIIINSNFINL